MSQVSSPGPAPIGDGPLISVILPVHNRERFVAEAIESILAQTYANLELIIADDSTDGSPGIVRDYAGRDARIRPLFLSPCTQWRARNLAVASARGAYVAHMDDDDVALPDRLAVQLAWMQRTGVDVCGGSIVKFGADRGLIWFPETHQAICHELVFRLGLLLPTVLMRGDVARAHPYDESLAYSDFAWQTQLAHHYRLGNLPQVVLKSRYHAQQLHVLEGAAFNAERSRYSRVHFRTLFPDATEQDEAAVARICTPEPFTSLQDLERAGTWLLRLAQTPDAFLRRRMADHWRGACRRSAPLGPGVFALFRRIAPQFGIQTGSDVFSLWLPCALRLAPDSKIHAVLAAARRMGAPKRSRLASSRMRMFDKPSEAC